MEYFTYSGDNDGDNEGDPAGSSPGDQLDCHSPVESRRALLQDHGLLQVSFFPGNICQILSFLLHHFRILGFYASGFILIVISLDRYVEIIFISTQEAINKEHTRYPPLLVYPLFSEDS